MGKKSKKRKILKRNSKKKKELKDVITHTINEKENKATESIKNINTNEIIINGKYMNNIEDLDRYFSPRQMISDKLLEEVFDLDGKIGLHASEI